MKFARKFLYQHVENNKKKDFWIVDFQFLCEDMADFVVLTIFTSLINNLTMCIPD